MPVWRPRGLYRDDRPADAWDEIAVRQIPDQCGADIDLVDLAAIIEGHDIAQPRRTTRHGLAIGIGDKRGLASLTAGVCPIIKERIIVRDRKGQPICAGGEGRVQHGTRSSQKRTATADHKAGCGETRQVENRHNRRRFRC